MAALAGPGGGSGIVESQFETAETLEDSPEFGFRNGSVVVAPIPFSNPTIGGGLALGGGGIGLRYRVSRKFPVDFSVDATANNLGENLLYVYVGQRF